MKKLHTLLVFIVAAALAGAASTPVITQGPVLPWRVQVDLLFDANGVWTSASPQVFFRQAITIDGVEVQRDLGVIAWDSVAKKDSTIAIKLSDGSTATTTRGAVLTAVIAIAAQERAAQGVQ